MPQQSINSLGGTTGSFNFAPGASKLIWSAFNRAGIRGSELQPEYMKFAAEEINFIQSDWANDQVNLWTVELVTQTLTQGQAAYAVDPSVVLILDAYLSLNPGTPQQTDLYMYPLSRTEYASIPNKNTPAQPTTFWFDRLISPNVYLWQPPAASSYTFNYYATRRMMDASTANAAQSETPYTFLKALRDALSVNLAIAYAPERVAMLKVEADLSYQRAKDMNEEKVPLYITPGLSSYYRS